MPKTTKKPLATEEKAELARCIHAGYNAGYKKFSQLLTELVFANAVGIDFDTVSDSDPRDKTLLFYALLNNQANFAELLIGFDADPFWMTAGGVCPLQVFFENNGQLSVRIIDQLIRKYPGQKVPEPIITTVRERLRFEKNVQNKKVLEKFLLNFAPKHVESTIDSNKRQRTETSPAIATTSSLPSLAQPSAEIIAKATTLLIPTTGLIAFFNSDRHSFSFLGYFRGQCEEKKTLIKSIREAQTSCDRLRINESTIKFKQNVLALYAMLSAWHKNIVADIVESPNSTNNTILLDIGDRILKLNSELAKSIEHLTVDFIPQFTTKMANQPALPTGYVLSFSPSNSNVQQPHRNTFQFGQ